MMHRVRIITWAALVVFVIPTIVIAQSRDTDPYRLCKDNATLEKKARFAEAYEEYYRDLGALYGRYADDLRALKALQNRDDKDDREDNLNDQFRSEKRRLKDQYKERREDAKENYEDEKDRCDAIRDDDDDNVIDDDDDFVNTCPTSSCPSPRPNVPTRTCNDGSRSGALCVRQTNNTCRWEIRQCNDDDDDDIYCLHTNCFPNNPDPNDSPCTLSECPNPPNDPRYFCDNGQLAGPVCARRNGVCRWEVRECPAGDSRTCRPSDCPSPRPAAPNTMCQDGSVGGPVCVRSNNSCRWQIRQCP